jgi:polyphosphate kinase 2
MRAAIESNGKTRARRPEKENSRSRDREQEDGAEPKRMKRREYEQELKKIQGELVKVQLWAKQAGAKIIVIFEGRDAAGKGGVIKAMTERTSPRVFRIAALPAPSEREKTQMYLQRYIAQFPSGGEITLFDRSWYNRAGVEVVMGFTPPDEVHRFLELCPVVEQMIIGSGIILIKYWFEVSHKEQVRRFKRRIKDPRKIWKLSPMDLESARRWYDYSRARDAMFKATDTNNSPWHVVPSDDKYRARLSCIKHFLSIVPYKEVPREKIKLPKRKKAKGYEEPKYPWRYVPEYR